jgi:hypothetical protein
VALPSPIIDAKDDHDDDGYGDGDGDGDDVDGDFLLDLDRPTHSSTGSFTSPTLRSRPLDQVTHHEYMEEQYSSQCLQVQMAPVTGYTYRLGNYRTPIGPFPRKTVRGRRDFSMSVLVSTWI